MNPKDNQLIRKLIEEGKAFNYDNFSIKGAYGYPQYFKPEYTSWYLRTEEGLKGIFGMTSSVFREFNKSKGLRPLGNGPDVFNEAQGYVMAALKTAIDMGEYEPPLEENEKVSKTSNKKVFVVHGHDEKIKNQTEIFLKNVGLEPIVLHRQPDEGQTIIEKFEKHSDVGYAFILLTPDDIGYPSTEENKEESEKKKNLRARQNVIFEFGYFVGKLGRARVCCLYKAGVELPADISGILYKEIKEKIEEVAYSILKDLKAAGYEVKI